MSGSVQVVARDPKDCHDTEIKDFMGLVLKGGEVAPKGLEERIRSAVSLVFLTIDCCLCGVAAIKSPNAEYRENVSSKSGIPLPEDEFPYEFGWVFIIPSAQGQKFSRNLTQVALSAAGAKGVFATSCTNNERIQATLKKFDFVSAGSHWTSKRGDYKLQLFIRSAAQPGAAPDGSIAIGATNHSDEFCAKNHGRI